jgi:hypothetical protein
MANQSIKEEFARQKQKQLEAVGRAKPQQQQKVEKSYISKHIESQKKHAGNIEELNSIAAEAFEIEMDFNKKNKGKSKSQIKEAEKIRDNKLKRVEERDVLVEDAFGLFVAIWDEISKYWVGGKIYHNLLGIYLMAIFFYYYDKLGFAQGLMAAAFMFFPALLARLGFSVIGYIYVHLAMGLGPLYECEIKKGSSVGSAILSIVNPIMRLLYNSWIVVSIALIIFCFYLFKWNLNELWASFHYSLAIFLLFTFCFWVYTNVVGFLFYHVLVMILLSGGNCKYRLRYACNRNKIITVTKGKLIDLQQRKQIFYKAHLNMA